MAILDAGGEIIMFSTINLVLANAYHNRYVNDSAWNEVWPWLAAVGFIFVTVIVIVGILWLARKAITDDKADQETVQESFEEILKLRLAKGEISDKEYEKKRQILADED